MLSNLKGETALMSAKEQNDFKDRQTPKNLGKQVHFF